MLGCGREDGLEGAMPDQLMNLAWEGAVGELAGASLSEGFACKTSEGV